MANEKARECGRDAEGTRIFLHSYIRLLLRSRVRRARGNASPLDLAEATIVARFLAGMR